MRSLMFFVWTIMGLWALWSGDYIFGVACLILAETNTIMLKLDKNERAIGILVKYTLARAKQIEGAQNGS